MAKSFIYTDEDQIRCPACGSHLASTECILKDPAKLLFVLKFSGKCKNRRCGESVDIFYIGGDASASRKIFIARALEFIGRYK